MLAQAEHLDVSGNDFLEALAVGYEVCCRLGRALTPATYTRGFHATSVAGIFGAVAGAADVRMIIVRWFATLTVLSHGKPAKGIEIKILGSIS
jgi:2-methylcitrate dehydratase PrpD